MDFSRIFKSFLFFFFSQKSFFFFFFREKRIFFLEKKKKKKRSFPTRGFFFFWGGGLWEERLRFDVALCCDNFIYFFVKSTMTLHLLVSRSVLNAGRSRPFFGWGQRGSWHFENTFAKNKREVESATASPTYVGGHRHKKK